MTRKERIEYMKWKRERTGPHLTVREQEMLAALDKVRNFTHGADAGDTPWHLALKRLRTAIEDVGTMMTGDREYFHAKHHSIGGK